MPSCLLGDKRDVRHALLYSSPHPGKAALPRAGPTHVTGVCRRIGAEALRVSVFVIAGESQERGTVSANLWPGGRLLYVYIQKDVIYEQCS